MLWCMLKCIGERQVIWRLRTSFLKNQSRCYDAQLNQNLCFVNAEIEEQMHHVIGGINNQSITYPLLMNSFSIILRPIHNICVTTLKEQTSYVSSVYHIFMYILYTLYVFCKRIQVLLITVLLRIAFILFLIIF